MGRLATIGVRMLDRRYLAGFGQGMFGKHCDKAPRPAYKNLPHPRLVALNKICDRYAPCMQRIHPNLMAFVKVRNIDTHSRGELPRIYQDDGFADIGAAIDTR